MKGIKMTFGKKLQMALNNAGMMQKELAKATGVGEASISRYVNDERFPNSSKLKLICKTLNCSADWLIGVKDD